MENIFNNLKENHSIVHCITNYVTVNDVANIILASGSSPIMADDPNEVEDIVSISNALVINIGTLNTRTIDSMKKAGKMANKLNIPVLFDPVGVGASKLRVDTSMELFKEIKFSVIKGNASEIKYLYSREKTNSGVDVDIEDLITEENIEEYIEISKEISKKYNTIVGITGKIDIITDGEIVYLIRNGNSKMEEVTGTGCMLSGLIGGIIGANNDNILASVVLGIIMMGVSGDKAKDYMEKNSLGIGSFKTSLMDNINLINYIDLKEEMKVEKR